MSIRNYGLIASIEELEEHIERCMGDVVGYDIETGYVGPDREKGAVKRETAILVGISFTNSTDWARYVPLGHDSGPNLDNYKAARLFWQLLRTGKGVAHNAAFELKILSKWFMEQLQSDPQYGEEVRACGGYFPIFSDSMVEAYLAAEQQRFGLKPLTKALFNHTMTELFELFPDLAKNKRKFLRFNTLPLEPRVIEYACEDSVWCLAIHQRYYPKVKDRLLYKIEKAIVQSVVGPMEDAGVVYDWTTMRRVADQLRAFRDKWNAEIQDELSEMAGEPVAVLLSSPKQVREILFDKLGFRTSVYTSTTRDLEPSKRVMSTGDIALTKLAHEHPVIKKILQWREQTKLLGTYLDTYESKFKADDGRVHPNHLSAFVVTGRFAVSDPPYQGSPKKYHFDLAEARAAHAAGEEPPPGTCFKFNFRDLIVAPPGCYILGFDLSQAELRAIAGEAKETALIEAFANGEDVHRLTASLMLGVPIDQVTDEQRSVGKTMNFALLYGMGVKSLADRLGIPIEEAQLLMDKYFQGFPRIAEWSANQIRMGKAQGYVTSKFGRVLPIWEYQSDKRWIYQKGDRACVNYPIQGAATGDYMKIAMVRAKAAIKAAGYEGRITLVMNIHDALEFYVDKTLQPQDAIAVLKPAVVFEVPGWPAMQADWHLAKKWGSPVEITVNDDGSLTVKGEKIYELKPSVEVDEETGEEVEALPEVDPDAIRKAVGRYVVIRLEQMPTQEQWSGFIKLLDGLAGYNHVRVETPEGQINLPYTVGLTKDHLGQVSALFPGCGMRYESDAIDADQILDGIRL